MECVYIYITNIGRSRVKTGYVFSTRIVCFGFATIPGLYSVFIQGTRFLYAIWFIFVGQFHLWGFFYISGVFGLFGRRKNGFYCFIGFLCHYTIVRGLYGNRGIVITRFLGVIFGLIDIRAIGLTIVGIICASFRQTGALRGAFLWNETCTRGLTNYLRLYTRGV